MSYFCRSIYRYSFPNRLCTTYQLTFKEHLLFQVESLEKERVEHCNQLNSLKEKLTQAEETIKRLTVACVWLFSPLTVQINLFLNFHCISFIFNLYLILFYYNKTSSMVCLITGVIQK